MKYFKRSLFHRFKTKLGTFFAKTKDLKVFNYLFKKYLCKF